MERISSDKILVDYHTIGDSLPVMPMIFHILAKEFGRTDYKTVLPRPIIAKIDLDNYHRKDIDNYSNEKGQNTERRKIQKFNNVLTTLKSDGVEYLLLGNYNVAVTTGLFNVRRGYGNFIECRLTDKNHWLSDCYFDVPYFDTELKGKELDEMLEISMNGVKNDIYEAILGHTEIYDYKHFQNNFNTVFTLDSHVRSWMKRMNLATQDHP